MKQQMGPNARDGVALTEVQDVHLGPGSRVAGGRYVIEKELGEGGMGAVYLAGDLELDRRVALKFPKFADEPDMVERFYREARAAANLSHPNACPVYDVGNHLGRPYMAMAYIDGKPLDEIIESAKRIAERSAALLIRKLALALQEAHDRGVVHRDLKPGNVIVDRRREPILMDFGLALSTRPGAERLTQDGGVVGSPWYMSPEQVRGKEIGPASDIYSLGAVLYEMLTGRAPFEGDPMAVIIEVATARPPAVESLRPSLSPDLAAICRKAMARKADDRFGSMREFASALTAYAKRPGDARTQPVNQAVEEEVPVATAVVEPRRTERQRYTRRRQPARKSIPWWLPAAGLAGVLLVAAVLGLTAGGSGEAGGPPGDGTPPPAAKSSGPTPAPAKASKRVKVFVIAGNSNAAGRAPVKPLYDLAKDAKWADYGLKRGPEGGLLPRDDVRVLAEVWRLRHGQDGLLSRRSTREGRLRPGFGDNANEFGPELAFGHVVGGAIDEPVLILKVTCGPAAMGGAYRPPGDGRLPGKMYARVIESVKAVLRAPGSVAEEYRGHRAVLAGLVWFQGYNDRPLAEDYGPLLADFLRGVRRDLDAPQLPIVVGELGVEVGDRQDGIRRAQKWATGLPEFRGNVRLVRTWDYVDHERPQQFLYGRKPETFLQIGRAFGTDMLKLLGRR